LKEDFSSQDIAEKVSYLKGLSEGSSITEGSAQGKIISGILNALNEMAEKEMQAETLIKAQGYEECVVVMSPALTTVMLG